MIETLVIFDIGRSRSFRTSLPWSSYSGRGSLFRVPWGREIGVLYEYAKTICRKVEYLVERLNPYMHDTGNLGVVRLRKGWVPNGIPYFHKPGVCVKAAFVRRGLWYMGETMGCYSPRIYRTARPKNIGNGTMLGIGRIEFKKWSKWSKASEDENGAML